MSFGKRAPGEGHPARDLLPPSALEDGASAVRTKAANSAGIDKNFIALALGVVIVSAGGAIAAPSVLEMFNGDIPLRPLNEVVVNLNHDQAKAALAREAFPDGEGRAFMNALAVSFPAEHNKLLDTLADEALKPGADRDDLITAATDWSSRFAPAHLQAIGRTGADGFDKLLTVASDSLQFVENAADGCTRRTLERFVSDPEALTKLASYGSEGYKLGMRASRVVVDLAARGANASPVETSLTPNDTNALQSTFFSLMTDKQLMGLMAAPRDKNMNAAAENLDICQLGRTIIVKLRSLPSGTKARVLGLATSGIDPSMLQSFSQLGGRQSGAFGQ